MTTAYLTRRLRSEAEVLAALSAAERRYDGPLPGNVIPLAEIAERRRMERRERRVELKTAAIWARLERAEHLRCLEAAIRRRDWLLTQPASPQRDRQLRFAEDAILENRERAAECEAKIEAATAELAAVEAVTAAAE